jgi:hypothetical protein
MPEDKTIEARVAALEAAVRELQSRVAVAPAAQNWWELIPPVTDLEAFEEGMAYGRAFRHADRPPDEPGDQS